MKIVALFCLTLSLVLSGCNLNLPSKSHPVIKDPELDISQKKNGIRINTMVIGVKKEPNTDWRTVFPGWEPKKLITVVNGDGQTLLAQIASNRSVSISIKGKTASVTSNKAPMPFSLQEQVQMGDHNNSYTVDMLLIPVFITKTEPMTLSVDMHIQVPQGDFSLSQVLSIPQRHSILAAHALDENTLQVIIITPEVPAGEKK